MSGRDQPHVPSSGAKKVAQTVHFTFMTGGGYGYEDEAPPIGHCRPCRWPVPEGQKFCGQCGATQPMEARMSTHKRMKEEVKEESELWDVVEPPVPAPPFSFEVPRSTAIAAAAMNPGSGSKGCGSVKMQRKFLLHCLACQKKRKKAAGRKKIRQPLKSCED